MRIHGVSRLILIVAFYSIVLHSQTHFATENAPRVPGQMVDVGGYRMHLYCVGKGSPTVILENGLGDIFSDWALVQPEVGKYTRVCSYDHAYEGYSDAGPVPVTMHQQVFETHLMLEKAKISPPYIIAGHSFGGMLARLFTLTYPQEVVGLIFVDSTHEDLVLRNKGLKAMSNGKQVPPVQTMKSGPPPPPTPEEESRFDERKKRYEKEAELPVGPPLDRLPPEALHLRAWAHAHPKILTGSESDPTVWMFTEVQHISDVEHSKPHPLGSMPIIVIGEPRDNPVSMEERRRQLDEMASLSTNGKVVIDQNSGHHVQWDDPAFVLQAIRQVFDASKYGGELPK